jgi:hypothetical protein
LELARLTAERPASRITLALLEAARLAGENDGANSRGQGALADAQARLEQYQRDATRLRSRRRPGTVLPPPNVPSNRAPHPAPLVGNAAGRAQSAYLERGTLLCLLGDRAASKPSCTSTKATSSWSKGQDVAIAMDHLPGQSFTGRVVEIAGSIWTSCARAAAAGDLPARTD